MTDKPDVTSPVSGERQRRPILSDSASAHAPFLYFEEASAMGHVNGIIRVTLEATRLVSTSNNELELERVVVAHLRMNIPAALGLKNAIDGAILLATNPQNDVRN